MAVRREYGAQQPLAGQRITGSLHMTIQTAVLIETLRELGADVRWASCNIFSTQDHAAAAVAVGPDGTRRRARAASRSSPGRARRSRSTGSAPSARSTSAAARARRRSWTTAATRRCSSTRASSSRRPARFPPARGPDSEEFAVVLKLLARELKKDPRRWTRIATDCAGVTEETTTGVHRLYEMQKAGTLLFPAINVNDSVTKSKFDNLYGCRHSLVDGLNRATDVMLAGKLCVVCGYGDVGKGCAQALRGQGARVVVTEIDPINALQATMEGYQVVRVEDVVEQADVFVTATGNVDVITVDHMKQMKDCAIVGNIGHFDNEIDMAGLKKIPGRGASTSSRSTTRSSSPTATACWCSPRGASSTSAAPPATRPS